MPPDQEGKGYLAVGISVTALVVSVFSAEQARRSTVATEFAAEQARRAAEANEKVARISEQQVRPRFKIIAPSVGRIAFIDDWVRFSVSIKNMGELPGVIHRVRITTKAKRRDGSGFYWIDVESLEDVVLYPGELKEGQATDYSLPSTIKPKDYFEHSRWDYFSFDIDYGEYGKHDKTATKFRDSYRMEGLELPPLPVPQE